MKEEIPCPFRIGFRGWLEVTTLLLHPVTRLLVSSSISARQHFSTALMSLVAPSRVRVLKEGSVSPSNQGGIVYWMSRDQRVQDNWALLYARELAAEKQLPLCVVFCLVPNFLEATIRHYGFMLRGLEEVESELGQLRVPFALLQGLPAKTLPAFLKEHRAAALVTDFSPLRVPVAWKRDVATSLPSGVPLYEVDAHNVVPVWVASDKQEVGARTIRKKITDKLPEWLVDMPRFEALAGAAPPPSLAKATATPVDWPAVHAGLTVDRSVGEIEWCAPGTAAAHAAVVAFCAERLKIFADKRNDPNMNALSNLSPYLHFGQLSAQRMALSVKQHARSQNEGVKAFLEESIVRRELSDNFCFYNPNYDSLAGAAGWARDSLELHAADKREYVYTLAQLEAAETHEDIWNAAQLQMARTGKMHGFMRMCTHAAARTQDWHALLSSPLLSLPSLPPPLSLTGPAFEPHCEKTGPKRSSNGRPILRRRSGAPST